MFIINQTLIMSFLGIIATSSIVFPVLFLVQRKKHHREWMELIKNKENHQSK